MNGSSLPALSGRRRTPALLVAFLLLPALCDPPAADGFQEKGGLFIVVSITQLGQGTIDVKLKNPRTGYVHSVTLHISLPLKLKIGDLVEKRQDPRRGVVLIPVRDEIDEPDEEEEEDEGHLRPVGSPETPPERKPVLPETKGPLKGYIVQPIEALRVLNLNDAEDRPKGSKALSLSKEALGSAGCHLLVNGSFTANYVEPAVPVVRKGKLDTKGYGKSLQPEDKALTQDGKGKITTDRRGGMAVYRDGSVVVGRQNGRTLEEINRTFGKVLDFMGGGALLIERGAAVSSTDLFEQQGFVDLDPVTHRVLRNKKGPRTGMNAGQLSSSARRTLIGVKDGKAFVIVSPPREGEQVRKDLLQAQFQDVVMFDGGYGFYFTDGVTEIKGRGDGKGGNSLGLCIWLASGP